MLEQPVGVCQERPSLRGEAQPLPRAREELHPELGLERQDLTAERRLGDVQLLGRARDVLVLGHHRECMDAIEVEHE